MADPGWIAARTESERAGPILANVKSTMPSANDIFRAPLISAGPG